MKTVIINDKIKSGQLFLEFLKTQSWAKIVEAEKTPNARARRAMKNAEKGARVTETENFEDFITKLNS
ncbi:MAG: hypothetical protein L3J35_03740 [Bacteroidales bacterium]|nr:hypothetical protein [Bacteroidales bacterium]